MKSFCLACALLWTGGAFAQQQQQQPTITTTAQEVLLDIVIRDKKGHIVKDLKPGELTVTEDGAAQQIRSMRLRTGAELSTIQTADAASSSTVSANTPPPSPPVNPLRDVRTVTFAFDPMASANLTVDRRNPGAGPDRSAQVLVKRVAEELLKIETGANFYWGVFATANRRVKILQPYTTDREKLYKAVDRALRMPGTVYTEVEPGEMATQAAGVNGIARGGGAAGGATAEIMAQMGRNMTEFNQDTDLDLRSDNDFLALRGMIRELRQLPGRKTLIYFTRGLVILERWRSDFHTLIADANRANVTIYCVDPSLAYTGYATAQGSNMLTQAANASATASLNNQSAVQRYEVVAGERAESAVMLNPHLAVASLAEDTGGFVIGNINNIDKVVSRLSEEINTYYEVTYAPVIGKYDGRFRRIAVQVARPGVKVQSRSGYFALPYVAGQTVSGFEMPLLSALSAPKLPRAIPYHSSVRSFGSTTEVIIDVPLDRITMVKDDTAKTFQCSLALLALFKDAQGNVVRKLSRDVPVTNTLAKLDATRAGHFIYTHHLQLPPGNYTFESAVMDRGSEAQPAGVKKQSVLVAEPGELALSSVTLVRKLAPPNPIIMDEEDPFEFGGGKITPELNESVKGGKEASIAVYLVAYTQKGQDNARLAIEFQQDGKLAARSEPPLPRPDAAGRIHIVANLPIDSFKPGQYEVRVQLVQSGKAVQERMLLNIEE